jgi:S1-C subfamily serine protease
MTSFSAFAKGLVLLLTLATATQALTGQTFIDDRKIKESLRTSLEKAIEQPDTVSGLALQKQLRAQKVIPHDLRLPESEAVKPRKKRRASHYSQLCPVTMVVGNIYKCGKCDKWHTGGAGGVVLSPDGLVLTNYHVIDSAEARVFGALDFEGQFYPIEKVIFSSKKNDLALVQLAGASDLPYVPLASNSKVGDSVVSVSHPDSHYFTFGSGRITRFYLSPDGRVPLGQVNLNFAKGSSGAGVFNKNAELTGLIVSTKSIYYENSEKGPTNLQMVVRTIVPLTVLKTFLRDAGVIAKSS